MTTIIFLDDERTIEDVTWIKYPKYNELIYVRTYFDFVKITNTIDDLSNVIFTFDHDLQDFSDGREYTGKSCANFLIDYIIKNNLNKHDLNFIVHSKNSIGSINIKSLLDNYVNCSWT